MALSRRRALLMDDAIRALPLWFRKSCILWYDPKRQGLTNEDIGTDNWKLKNLMDKETCYPYNWEPYKNGIGTTATSNKLTINRCYDFAHLIYPSSEYHGRIKVTNLELNKETGSSSGMLRIYRAKSSDNSVIGDAIVIEKDGIYDINLNPMEGGNKIYFYIPGNGTILETPIIIEQLPTSKGDMKLVNFGKYVFDFTKFGYNGNFADESTVTIESNKITILNNHSSTASLITTRASNTSTTPFRIKITGIESGYRIRMGHDNKIVEGIQTNFWEFTEDGTYTIYTNLGDYPNFGIMYNKIGDCNVVIEELPEPASCGRGRCLDTPFPQWTLPTTYDTSCSGDRTLNINSITWDKYNSEQNAAATVAYSSLSSSKISHKYKISGLDSTKYEIWFGNDTADQWRSQNIVATVLKDGIYTVPWADAALQSNNNTACIAVHRKEYTGTNIKESINITIEQVPEYQDALVFDGVDDFSELDGYIPADIDYTILARKILLDKSDTGRTSIGSTNVYYTGGEQLIETYGYDWTSDQHYGDKAFYGSTASGDINKLISRNWVSHSRIAPSTIINYSTFNNTVDLNVIKVNDNQDYNLDSYYLQATFNGEENDGIITPNTYYPLLTENDMVLSFEACSENNEPILLGYNYIIIETPNKVTSYRIGSITVESETWRKYQIIFNIPQDYRSDLDLYPNKILIGTGSGKLVTLNIKNIKVEIGNKATPYQPAIEDFNIKPSRNLTNYNSTLFQTGSHFYNIKHPSGNNIKLEGGTKLYLGKHYHNPNFQTNFALYSFLLFNRNLTTEEIQWIEENIIPPLPEELSSVYAEGYWKDYTFWRNTDIWRDDIIPDLFVDSGKDYKSVINTDYCPKPVGLYSAKGKTNADTDKDILYDLSGNGNHIKLYNVAFNGMDGYGGYPFNENNIVAHEGAIKIGYNKYQLTGGWSYLSYSITQGQPITYNIRVSEIQGKNRIAAYCIYSGHVYSEVFNLYEGDNRVTLPADNTGMFVLACPRTDNQASCVVEFLPEYPDGLIFNGTNAYGITGVIDKEFKDYTVIIKRKLLNNTGYTCALDDASMDGSGNSTFFVEGTDCYSYGYDNDVPLLTRFKDSQYIWQTSDSFCGIPIIRGNIVPNNQKLSIGTAYPNDLSFCQNIVFYSLDLFDKKLTSQQIEWFIRNKM